MRPFLLRLTRLVLIISLTIHLYSCEKDVKEVTVFKYEDLIPSHFVIPDIEVDSFPTEAKIKLGKKLFYDPVLSIDSTISCSSCHKQEYAFADNVALSNGVFQRSGTRNSPSIANVVYQKRLLREGGIPTLEMQILVPIQEHNEFDNNIVSISEKLNNNEVYKSMAHEAFGRDVDPFVITRAIAAFERVLISGESTYDKYITTKNEGYLSKEAIEGIKLFNSNKTNCSSCHSGILFTNQEYENNGLYEYYNDIGKERLTNMDSDNGRFKIPSLRNIEITSPYMHDGSIKTLEEVIEHYNNGGSNHRNKNSMVKPLNLTEIEKKQLKAFLIALTDKNFINNKYYMNE